MDVPTLLERINHKHGADLKLKGRYAQGENQGAYAIQDASGTPFVLKWQATTEMLSRLERARLVAERELRRERVAGPDCTNIRHRRDEGVQGV